MAVSEPIIPFVMTGRSQAVRVRIIRVDDNLSECRTMFRYRRTFGNHGFCVVAWLVAELAVIRQICQHERNVGSMRVL